MKKTISRFFTRLKTKDLTNSGVGLGIAAASMMSVSTVHAAGDPFTSITTEVSNILSQVYGMIKALTIPTAIVVISAALFNKIFVKDERAIAQINAWIKRAIIAWIMIYSLTYLVDFISSFTSGKDVQTWS